MSGNYPSLGFDPTPGELSAVGAVLESLLNAANQINECSIRLLEAVRITDDAEWGGSAAEEFSDHGDDLPKGLSTGAESISAVGSALQTWANQMFDNQAKADELERRAKKLKEQLRRAGAAVEDAAGAMPRSVDNPRYAATQAAFLDAVNEEARLREALDRVIDEATRLRAKHLREANAAAEVIRGGPDDAFQPENDGFGVQLLDGISVVSGQVAMWSGTVAAIAAVVPGGQPVAAVLGTTAAAAGGVKALSGLGQRMTGSSNAPTVAELALDVVPLRAGTSGARAAFTAARGARGQGARAMTGNAMAGARDGARRGLDEQAFVRTYRDGREYAKRYGDTGSLGDAVRQKASRAELARGRELAGDDAGRLSHGDLRDLARAQARREAAVAGLGSPFDGYDTYQKITGSGGELPGAAGAFRDGLGYVLDPSGSRVDKIIESRAKDAAKGDD